MADETGARGPQEPAGGYPPPPLSQTQPPLSPPPAAQTPPPAPSWTGPSLAEPAPAPEKRRRRRWLWSLAAVVVLAAAAAGAWFAFGRSEMPTGERAQEVLFDSVNGAPDIVSADPQKVNCFARNFDIMTSAVADRLGMETDSSTHGTTSSYVAEVTFGDPDSMVRSEVPRSWCTDLLVGGAATVALFRKPDGVVFPEYGDALPEGAEIMNRGPVDGDGELWTYCQPNDEGASCSADWVTDAGTVISLEVAGPDGVVTPDAVAAALKNDVVPYLWEDLYTNGS